MKRIIIIFFSSQTQFSDVEVTYFFFALPYLLSLGMSGPVIFPLFVLLVFSISHLLVWWFSGSEPFFDLRLPFLDYRTILRHPLATIQPTNT